MSENNYIFNRFTNSGAHPQSTNYLGSSPPHKNYAIYLDFDNVYGGLLDFLNIKVKVDKPSELQFSIFQEILKCLIIKLSTVFPERAKYVKAFAEYENLPHKNKFKPNLPSFLYNIGVKPVNPFVAYSTGSGKGKNASDIALSLEIVSDILVKKNPINAIIIASGDIDLYPLISWIREYTDKEIFIASFEKRLNSIYKQVIDFKFNEHPFSLDKEKYFIDLDRYAVKCFKEISFSLIRDIYSSNIKEKKKSLVKSLSWLKNNIKKILLDKEILEDEEKKLALKLLETDFEFIENETKEEINENCEKLKKNLVKGLKSWLKSHNKASTGLIIKSWLPRWNIDISEYDANLCLKNILEDIKKSGFKFEGEINNNLVVGEFKR